MIFPIEAVRSSFPALAVTDEGRSRSYFDAPGGTQVCIQAIERMRGYMTAGVANAGGDFATSRATDEISGEAHRIIADLLGGKPHEIAIGPNMTSLTLALSRALARDWRAGDELVVTRLDHDANIAPWLAVAEERGMVVRWLDFDPESGRLCIDQLASLLSERTRLVAVGGASNAIGTLNDLPRIISIVRSHSGALIHVDGVQLVPHMPVDVDELGADFFSCSLYKLYGPHLGALWGREELLEQVSAYKVRPARTNGAARFETGALSFESLAGVLGFSDYLEGLANSLGATTGGRRRGFLAAMGASAAYEAALGERFLNAISRIDGLRLFGPPTMEARVPTFGFTLDGRPSPDIARELGARGIFLWAGHFYAVETIARLGLDQLAGLVRVGLCHYHSEAEVDGLVTALEDIASTQTASGRVAVSVDS